MARTTIQTPAAPTWFPAASVRGAGCIQQTADAPASTVVSVMPDNPKPRERRAKFEISKDHAGKFRFHLKAPNGEIVAASQGYESKASAEKGIEAIKTHAPGAKVEDHSDA